MPRQPFFQQPRLQTFWMKQSVGQGAGSQKSWLKTKADISIKTMWGVASTGSMIDLGTMLAELRSHYSKFSEFKT